MRNILEVSDSPEQQHLIRAIHLKSLRHLTQAFASGANPNLPGGYGIPFQYACNNPHYEMLELFLKNKADPNIGLYGKTAFHTMLYSLERGGKIPMGAQKIIELFVRHGAQLHNDKDFYNATCHCSDIVKGMLHNVYVHQENKNKMFR